MIFVYNTENVKKHAKKYGCLDTLNSLTQKIEKTQSFSFLDNFPPPFVVKKKFGFNGGRLIGLIETIKVNDEEHSVIVFIAILQHSNNYENFTKDPENIGFKLYSDACNINEIQEFVENRLKKDPPKPKEKLSQLEQKYLTATSISCTLDNEDLICETQTWIDKILLKSYNEKMTRIFDTLRYNLISNLEENQYKFQVQETNLIIYANYYPQHKIWFLTDITEVNETPVTPLLSNQPDKIEIFKQTFRAYPQFMLADETIWRSIENDPLGNYSLSEEETHILDSVSGINAKFPLFINGRAGSGKSTILQYIFSGYLYRYLSHPGLEHPPVYFASNPKLISQAKILVRSILTSNTNYSLVKSSSIEQKIKDDKPNSLFDNSFKEFKEFLLSKIPINVRNNLFANEKYINYSKFKEWWKKSVGSQQSASKNYGPDLSWHVIRTYIKGTSVEDFLERDDYTSLDANQQSVSNEVYQLIYDKVWNNNYSELKNKGFWDDQDLVRYVLDNDLIKPEIPGIFCDEAQDFTKIELEAFLRMSLFSNRQIMTHEIPKIPFVFAGDEFQTLNPTGFKWDSVKAMFTEKFILAVNPTANNLPISNKLTINYQTLLNNYRSSSHIVGFCNFIQALRIARFKLTGVKPQKEWSNRNEQSPVVSYLSNSEIFWNGIKKRAADTVFIIPASEDKILEYIKNDPNLNEHIPIDLKRNVPSIPVLTPIMAKGLEYPCVVVYGFGEVCDNNIFAWPNKDKDESYSKRLSLEYFLNKIYVAASRPKKQLYIVDTQNGMDKLWKFATNPSIELEIRNRCPRFEEWEQHISHLNKGESTHMQTDFKNNLSDSTAQLEEMALAQKDPMVLRMAARQYSDAKILDKSYYCEAKADEIDEEYEKAAINYQKSYNLNDALRCLWLMKNDKGLNKIIEFCEANKTEYGTRTEYLISKAIHDRKPHLAIAALKSLKENLEKNNVSVLLVSMDVLKYNLNSLMKIIQIDSSNSEKALEIFNILNKLDKNGLEIDKLKLTQSAFYASLYEDVVRISDEIGETNSIYYYKSKAKTTCYPETLSWLYHAKAWKDICEAYNLNLNYIDYTNEQYITLIRALLLDKQIGTAKKFLPKLQQRKDYELLLRNSKDYSIPSNWISTLEEAINLCILREYGIKEIWNKVFITNGEVPALRPKLVAKAIARLFDLQNYIPNNGDAEQASLRGISDFLAHYYLDENKKARKYDPEVGAAFELTKNYSYSQQYYKLANVKDTAATERMIYCMEKHAKIYDKQGNKTAAENILRDAVKLRSSIGIADNYSIPEFPNVNSNWSILFDSLFDEQEITEWRNISKKMEQDLAERIETEKRKELLKAEQEIELNKQKIQLEISERLNKSKANKNKNNPEFSQNGFCFKYKANYHRLNIEREEDGMTCSIIKGTTISGNDFEYETYSEDSNYKRIVGTDIIIKLAESENGTFYVKFINSDVEYSYSSEK